MVRLTITLPDPQYEALVNTAKTSGKSIAQVIQDSLEKAGIRVETSITHAAPPANNTAREGAEKPVPRQNHLRVIDEHSFQTLGELGELTREGLMIIAPQPLVVERNYDVFIMVTDRVDEFEKSRIKLQIEPRWCKPKPDSSGIYWIGCQFFNLSPSDFDSLQRLIQRTRRDEVVKRSARKNLIFYLETLEQKSGQVLGYLGDLSGSGLLIISEQPLPLNTVRAIRIKLPDLEEFTKKFIDLEVEIRWTKPDINPNLHCIGCSFLHISEEDRAVIKQVQEVLGAD